MARGHLTRRWTRWLAAGAIGSLPACSAFEVPDASIAYRPHPATVLPRSKSPSSSILLASAQVPEVPEAKDGSAEKEPRPPSPNLPAVPAAESQGKPLPINLATALTLSGASPLDIGIAEERVRAASAQLQGANALWFPDINLGLDYFRHDGQIQDIVGTVFTTSRSSLLLGYGPQAVFAMTDALYAPLSSRQVVRARQADAQAVRNDTTLKVAEAYFDVQQARGELAGSVDALRRADELVARTEKLAPALTPDVEINRAKAEAAKRRQAVEVAYERWQVAGAELTRLLRLEPATIVEPAEEPSLKIDLIDPAVPPEELIPIALTYRPELAADQAVIQAALARIRQEKMRPFIPTLAFRGVGSNQPGLAGGYFGGGVNDDMQAFGSRFSFDIQAIWEFQNLGYGNRALIREREAANREALLQLLRTQDLVTAEVVQAHARVRRAANRLKAAETGLADAIETAEKNVLGLGQTKRVGEALVLIFRPQEAVAAVSTLDQAYHDYYAAVGDHNRAQFQLYRALGHPAQCLGTGASPPAVLPGTMVPAPMPEAPPAAVPKVPPTTVPPPAVPAVKVLPTTVPAAAEPPAPAAPPAIVPPVVIPVPQANRAESPEARPRMPSEPAAPTPPGPPTEHRPPSLPRTVAPMPVSIHPATLPRQSGERP